MMMNKKILGSFFFATVFFHGLESSFAFQIFRQARKPSKMFAVEDSFGEFDLDLVEDLANNFGKYSVDEIELCLDGTKKKNLIYNVTLQWMTFSHFFLANRCSVELIELHARRVQHVAFQDDVNSPDVIKERFLETELIMQLEALKQEMPESYLFPDEDLFDSGIDTTSMSIDGLLEDSEVQAAVDLQSPQETELSTGTGTKTSLFKGLANEGVLETIAMCLFIGFVLLAPDSI